MITLGSSTRSIIYIDNYWRTVMAMFKYELLVWKNFTQGMVALHNTLPINWLRSFEFLEWFSFTSKIQTIFVDRIVLLKASPNAFKGIITIFEKKTNAMYSIGWLWNTLIWLVFKRSNKPLVNCYQKNNNCFELWVIDKMAKQKVTLTIILNYFWCGYALCLK